MKNPQPHAFDDRGLPLNGQRHPTDKVDYERPLVAYPGDFQIEGDVLKDWQGNVLAEADALDQLALRAGPGNTVLHDGKLKMAGDLLPKGT